MKRWIVFAITLVSSACLSQRNVDPTPVVEVPAEEAYIQPTGTPDCQPSSGVSLEVQQIDSRSVRLHASGLQPGEVPRIIYSAFAKSEGMYVDEGEFSAGADEQGEFTHALRGLQLGRMASDGPFTATWDIRLIHARGVACASMTLP